MNHQEAYELGYSLGYEDGTDRKQVVREYQHLDAYQLGYGCGYYDGLHNLEPDYSRGRRREIERERLSFFAI